MPTVKILGPYRDRQSWRYVIVYPDRKRRTVRWPQARSEDDARVLMAEYLEGHGLRTSTHTVASAVVAYLADLEASGQATVTVAWHRAAFAPLLEASGTVDLDELRPAHLEAFIAARAGRALATQETYWLAVVRLVRWLVARRHIRRDVCAEAIAARETRREPFPWATRAGRKAKGRGKAQLRNLAEARAYLAAALRQPTAERRCAAALPLLVGLASGEVRHLRACDVDPDAGVIRVRSDADVADDDGGGWEVKTSSRRRTVAIPGDIADDLSALVAVAAGHSPTAYLFPSRGDHRVAHEKAWLRGLVREVCERAGCRVVPPHGLRGTYASVLDELGHPVAEIGDALGHGDRGRTASRHYVGGRRARALRLIDDHGDAPP